MPDTIDVEALLGLLKEAQGQIKGIPQINCSGIQDTLKRHFQTNDDPLPVSREALSLYKKIVGYARSVDETANQVGALIALQNIESGYSKSLLRD